MCAADDPNNHTRATYDSTNCLPRIAHMPKSQVALHTENQTPYPQNMAENRKTIVVPSCYGHMGPNLSHLLKVMEFRQGWLWSRMSSKVEPICQYKTSCYFWYSPNKTSSFKVAWISQVPKSQTQSWGIFQKCSDSCCVDVKAVNSRLAFSLNEGSSLGAAGVNECVSAPGTETKGHLKHF